LNKGEYKFNKKATAGHITFTENSRALFTKEQEQNSAGWNHFLISDNIHPYQNLFIDDAALLARVAMYIYSKFHQLLSVHAINQKTHNNATGLF
jgi:hypothetical protein